MLMVMIYAGGHISGGHYNPAVTMAALVRRRIGIGDAAGYWIAQIVAGVVAGALARAGPPRTSASAG
jgi:aquaporin Z